LSKKKHQFEQDVKELEQITKEETKEKVFMDSVDGVVSESLMLANWIMSMADSASCLSKTSFHQLENRILAQQKCKEYLNLLMKINLALLTILGSGWDTNLNKNTKKKSW